VRDLWKRDIFETLIVGSTLCDELKKMGLTNTDIEAIRELSARYQESVIQTGRPAVAWEPDAIRPMLYLTCKPCIAARIAKARASKF
jgi:hypothetical protein